MYNLFLMDIVDDVYYLSSVESYAFERQGTKFINEGVQVTIRDIVQNEIYNAI